VDGTEFAVARIGDAVDGLDEIHGTNPFLVRGRTPAQERVNSRVWG
jgi:hypothetical protein